MDQNVNSKIMIPSQQLRQENAELKEEVNKIRKQMESLLNDNYIGNRLEGGSRRSKRLRAESIDSENEK